MRASENPFAVQRIHALRFQFDGTESIAGLAGKFWERVNLGQRSQVLLGGHGSGKSTLLHELGQFWREAGLDVIELNGAHRGVSTEWKSLRRDRVLGRNSIVLIDSGERLVWWDWLRLWWHLNHSAVLMTAHAAGRLAVLYHCQPSFQQFDSLCRNLVLENWDMFDAAWPPVERQRLFAKHGGDIRQCFFELYDGLAQGTGPPR
jgi:hypothetical protein